MRNCPASKYEQIDMTFYRCAGDPLHEAFGTGHTWVAEHRPRTVSPTIKALLDDANRIIDTLTGPKANELVDMVRDLRDAANAVGRALSPPPPPNYYTIEQINQAIFRLLPKHAPFIIAKLTEQDLFPDKPPTQ